MLRNDNGLEILAFQHPLAGFQLVKGTIEPNENPREAAIRELEEESGILNAAIAFDLGVWESGYQNQIWSFHICKVDQPIPDNWIHHTSDDGGHDFRFFWHLLDSQPSSEWHDIFQDALIFVRSALKNNPTVLEL